jgi:hypothetical protein
MAVTTGGVDLRRPRVTSCGRSLRRVAASFAVLASLACALSAGVGQARTSLEGSHSAAKPRTVVSPNWSGYVATAPAGHTLKYKSVTGTWTVPSASCGRRRAATLATVWVGLGGFTTQNQEEVGTDTNCTKAGKPFYYAWFEVVPYLSYPTTVTNTIAPGDTMTGLVRIRDTRHVELQIRDRTKGWVFTRTIAFSSQDSSTADWVVEAPATCVETACSEASLTDFGSATMRDISAVANGKTGTLADPHWRVFRVRLVPSRLIVPTISPTATTSSPSGRVGTAKSPAGATPGKLSRDGSSFSWSWIKVATHGV